MSPHIVRGAIVASTLKEVTAMKLKPWTSPKTIALTRKHYECIAEVINECPISNRNRITVAAHFANKLSVTNTNFDRAKFLKACGVEGNEEEGR
jgi:hypothetical protein